MAIERFSGQGLDASASTGPPEFAYTIIYDYDGSGNVIYIGYALSAPTPSGVAGWPAQTSLIPTTGPIAAGAYWAIKKFTYNAGNQLTSVQWANGNTQMVSQWSARATTVVYQ